MSWNENWLVKGKRISIILNEISWNMSEFIIFCKWWSDQRFSEICVQTQIETFNSIHNFITPTLTYVLREVNFQLFTHIAFISSQEE